MSPAAQAPGPHCLGLTLSGCVREHLHRQRRSRPATHRAPRRVPGGGGGGDALQQLGAVPTCRHARDADLAGEERRPLGFLQTCPPLPGAAPGARAPGRPCPGTEGRWKPSLNPGKPLTSLRNRGSKASSLLPRLGEEQGGRRCEHLVSPKQQGQAPGGPAGCSACGWGAVSRVGSGMSQVMYSSELGAEVSSRYWGAPRITHRAWTGFGVVLLWCLHFRVTSAPSAPPDLVHQIWCKLPPVDSEDALPTSGLWGLLGGC